LVARAAARHLDTSVEYLEGQGVQLADASGAEPSLEVVKDEVAPWFMAEARRVLGSDDPDSPGLVQALVGLVD